MFRSSRVYVCTRLSRAIADSAWLSKQLENGSSRPRAIEAANRGKHAYPGSGLQIAEISLEGETSLYHLGKNSEQHSWIAPARQKMHCIHLLVIIYIGCCVRRL